MKLDLLTNAAVVDDTIRFVSAKTTEVSDYDGDKDQLEEQEEQTGETTINQIF